MKEQETIQDRLNKKISKRQVEQTLTTKNCRYQLEYIKCGKKGCNKCPHGPYWYAYFIVNGREVCKYIGKELDLIPGDQGQFRRKYEERLRISAEQHRLIAEIKKAKAT